MQHINQLTQNPGNSHRPSGSLSTVAMQSTVELSRIFKNMPRDSAESIFLFKFWLRMGESYRQLWTDTQGTSPTDLWARYLLKIGEKRASEALVGILKSGNTYPPTLPEFIAASKPPPSYYQIFKALPRPAANPEIAKAAIKAMRSALYGHDVVSHINGEIVS